MKQQQQQHWRLADFVVKIKIHDSMQTKQWQPKKVEQRRWQHLWQSWTPDIDHLLAQTQVHGGSVKNTQDNTNGWDQWYEVLEIVALWLIVSEHDLDQRNVWKQGKYVLNKCV